MSTQQDADAIKVLYANIETACSNGDAVLLAAAFTEDADALQRIVSLHPMGRLGEADEIAKAALFLASDDASFITGANLAVDGRYTAQ